MKQEHAKYPQPKFPGAGSRAGKTLRALRCGGWLSLGLALATPLAALNSERKADSYSIQGWFTEHGLPSNKVRAVTQARDGYLWLATAQGIARFDGSQFTVFTGATNPELRGGGFFAALEAPDGTLWFGGDNGLFRWRNGQFDRFTTEQGLAHNYVRALALGRDGAIVACTRAGYSFMRGGRITTPAGVWKQITGVTRSYLERADGSSLLGTDDGLWRISGETIARLSGAGGLPGNGFTSLLETADGTLWIGYSGGVHAVHPDGKTEDYGAAQGLATPRVAAMDFDRDGNLWIATYGPLYRLAHGRIEVANYDEQGTVTQIQRLWEDREGGLWLATATGLFHLKDNVSSTIGLAEGLAQTSVYSVFEAQDGTWWIGLWNGGVYRYDQTRATRLATPGSPVLDQILSFAEEPAGTLWIGSYTGLYRLTGGALTNLYRRDQAGAWQKQLAAQPDSIFPGIAHSRVNSLATDGAGGLWVATDGALYHGNEGHFRAYTTADGLPGNVFKSVLRARNGDIWVTAPPLGAACFHEGKWTSYLCGAALSAIYPRAVYEDTAGAIWVTTEGGGLNRFKDGRWRIFTAHDGLAGDFISGLVEDGLGNFWIAYPRGIMRIPHDQFDELVAGRRATLEPRIFNRFDGLPTGETNQQGLPNAWRTRDGRLLFATDGGVTVIDPREIKTNALKPPVHIERLVVNGADAALSRPVVVPPGSNDIEIHYTAISLLAPERVRFKIRLAPLDRDWVDTGARRDVRYAKLPAGDYTFRGMACNNDGVWNDADVALAFTVRPFFFQTGWFTALVAVTGIGIVFGIYRARIRLARKQMAALEIVVEERTHELRLAKDAAEEAGRAKSEVIGALKQAQEETLRERTRFKFIFEALPVGIAWMVTGKLQTRIVNAAHAQITGVPIARRHQLKLYRQATHPDDRHLQDGLHERLVAGETDHYAVEKRYVHPDDRVCWGALAVRSFRDSVSGELQEITTIVDITGRKQAEAEREKMNRQLLDVSRQAGMAEVATGVLHNVGNVLNSVNVSTTLLTEQVRRSKIDGLAKLGELLRAHESDLATFFAADSRGRQVPGFVDTLFAHLTQERADMLDELESLHKNIEHLKEIVAMQQNYAKVAGVTEAVAVSELVEDALRMNASALARHDVTVVRDYQAQPVITVEKHKVLQILVNVMRNAKYACGDSGRSDKQMIIHVSAAGGRVKIAVSDNGVGIPAENLTRIFSHGFTTRKQGHGFGLHNGALAAREIGGSLTAQSEGPGRGATFVLELPEQPEARVA